MPTGHPTTVPGSRLGHREGELTPGPTASEPEHEDDNMHPQTEGQACESPQTAALGVPGGAAPLRCRVDYLG